MLTNTRKHCVPDGVRAGSFELGAASAQRDHAGAPQLPSWEQVAAAVSAPGGPDELAARLVEVLRRRGAVEAIWAWPGVRDLLVGGLAQGQRRCAADTMHAPSCTLPCVGAGIMRRGRLVGYDATEGLHGPCPDAGSRHDC